MQAGRLRQRVQLLKADFAQDEHSGAVIENWQSAGDVWAAVEPLSARDFIAAAAAQSDISARALIRHREGIESGMRLQHGAQLFHIEGVLADKASGREHLTLLLKQVA